MTDPNSQGSASGAASGTSDGDTSELDTTPPAHQGAGSPPRATSSDWSETTRAQVDGRAVQPTPVQPTTVGPRPVGGHHTTAALPVPPPSAPADAKKAKRPGRAGAPPNAVDQYAAAMAGVATPSAQTAAYGVPTAPPMGQSAFPLPPAPAPTASGPPPVGPGGSATPGRQPRYRPDRAPRRARLQLRHLNVWSVLKFSCVLAVALFFVWLIMIGVLYGILDVLGVFGKVNDTYRTINGNDNAKDIVTSNLVLGGAFVIGLVNIVLFIAVSTIGSIVYNLCADLVGGIEVTLAERDS